MHGLVCAVSRRQVLPGSTGAQNPQRPFKGFAPITPRPAATVRAHAVRGQEALNDFPLLIG